MSKKADNFYEECYCKVVIEYFYPALHLAKNERPDWIDEKNSIGIECTIAQVGEEYKLLSKYATYRNTPDKIRNKKKYLKDLQKQYPGVLDHGFFYCTQNVDAWPSLEHGLQSKLQKFDDGKEPPYRLFDHNALAFYLENPLYPQQFQDYLQKFVDAQNACKRAASFDTIYVCGPHLIVYHLQEKAVEIKPFSPEQQADFSTQAVELEKDIIGNAQE